MSPPEERLCIALATPDYPPDPMGTGIGTYAKSLAEALVGRGWRVHVVTRGPSGDATETRGTLTVHRIGVARPELPARITPLVFLRLAARSAAGELRYRWRVASALDQLVRDEGVQLVEAADSFVEALFYRPGRHPGVPFVIRLHTPMSVAERFDRNLPEPARRLLQGIERWYVRRATHLTVPSATPRRTFRAAMRLFTRPIYAIPNPPPSSLVARSALRRGCPEAGAEDAGTTGAGPDPTRAAAAGADHAGASGAGSSSAEPEVLYVGRVTAVKGVYVLADAIPKVLERVPAARFRFVGADSTSSAGQGSTIEEIRRRLPPDAARRVDFEGRVPLERVGEYLERATVCVFPSLFENFPYTCLEAMVAGKAIVGSEEGGMRDLLDRGACGLLYRPPDSDDLAGALVRLLEEPSLRSRLAEAARQRATSAYGEERVMAATTAFYREAVDSCA